MFSVFTSDCAYFLLVLLLGRAASFLAVRVYYEPFNWEMRTKTTVKALLIDYSETGKHFWVSAFCQEFGKRFFKSGGSPQAISGLSDF